MLDLITSSNEWILSDQLLDQIKTKKQDLMEAIDLRWLQEFWSDTIDRK